MLILLSDLVAIYDHKEGWNILIDLRLLVVVSKADMFINILPDQLLIVFMLGYRRLLAKVY